MILSVPNPLFGLVAYLSGVNVPSIPGPGLIDIDAGRMPQVTNSLEDLLTSCARYSNHMHVCLSVLESLKELENEYSKGVQVSAADSAVRGKRYLDLLLTRIREKKKLGLISSSFRELLVWIMRVITVISVIYLIWFVFIHDY